MSGSVKTLLSSEAGNPCAGARDQAACVRELSQLTQPSAACVQEATCDQSVENSGQCRPPAACGNFAILTAADVLQRIDDPDALVPWLGEIDTDSEAILLAMLLGLHPACPSSFQHNRGIELQDTQDGYRVRSDWDQCSGLVGRDHVEVRRDGSAGEVSLVVLGQSSCIIGRRPDGLCLSQQPSTGLASYLARLAQLEAASIYAFQQLTRELRMWGAGSALVDRAERAARDEVRHARIMASLARQYGAAKVAPARIVVRAERSRLEVAIENAVEGCVRETFGAVIGQHQAALAQDQTFAHWMRVIAADELRHAELSWHVAAWLEPQLTATERDLVDQARRAAWQELFAQVASEAMPAVDRARLGIPTPTVQCALLLRMAGELALAA